MTTLYDLHDIPLHLEPIPHLSSHRQQLSLPHNLHGRTVTVITPQFGHSGIHLMRVLRIRGLLNRLMQHNFFGSKNAS